MHSISHLHKHVQYSQDTQGRKERIAWQFFLLLSLFHATVSFTYLFSDNNSRSISHPPLTRKWGDDIIHALIPDALLSGRQEGSHSQNVNKRFRHKINSFLASSLSCCLSFLLASFLRLHLLLFSFLLVLVLFSPSSHVWMNEYDGEWISARTCDDGCMLREVQARGRESVWPSLNLVRSQLLARILPGKKSHQDVDGPANTYLKRKKKVKKLVFLRERWYLFSVC